VRLEGLGKLKQKSTSSGFDSATFRLVLLFIIIIWFVRLLAMRPLLTYCASLGAIVKMIVEKQTECRLAGETDVLGENLPQRHFCPSQNPT
jgi:hypothetical protein